MCGRRWPTQLIVLIVLGGLAGCRDNTVVGPQAADGATLSSAVATAPEPCEGVPIHRQRLALIGSDFEVGGAEDQDIAPVPPELVRAIQVNRVKATAGRYYPRIYVDTTGAGEPIFEAIRAAGVRGVEP